MLDEVNTLFHRLKHVLGLRLLDYDLNNSLLWTWCSTKGYRLGARFTYPCLNLG